MTKTPEHFWTVERIAAHNATNLKGSWKYRKYMNSLGLLPLYDGNGYRYIRPVKDNPIYRNGGFHTFEGERLGFLVPIRY